MLTTHNLLEGMGVGDSSATALAATLSWLVRDGAGMLSSLAFSTWGAQRFDLDVKTWRLFADLINDFALLLEFCVPMMPKSYFLPLLCVSAVCKALCSVAAGCTRGVISQHFAGPSAGRNLSDVAAKESTQETAVRLLGLWAGYLVAPWLLGDAHRAAVAFVTLTLLHAAANYAGITCLALNTLNANRIDVSLVHIAMAANARRLDEQPSDNPNDVPLASADAPTNVRKLSSGTILATVFHPSQIAPAPMQAAAALQDYAQLLQGYRLDAARGQGWLDRVVTIVLSCTYTPFVLMLDFLCSLVAQIARSTILFVCGRRIARPSTAQSPRSKLSGPAALLPTPTQVAAEEPLIPAFGWSAIAALLSGVWNFLQCRSSRRQVKLSFGSSVHALLQHSSGTASLCRRVLLCQRADEQLTIKDRAALNLALRSVQGGRSSLLAVHASPNNAWGVGPCAEIQVVVRESAAPQEIFHSYATASLLRPLLQSGLLQHATRDSVQDVVQTCATAANAAWACFASHKSQSSLLPWSHRWQPDQLLLPDEGWRLQMLQQKAAPDAFTTEQKAQEKLQDELDDLSVTDEERMEQLQSPSSTSAEQTLRSRARSTGRKRP